MNEYRRQSIISPLVAEIRNALAKEYRRIHRENPETARMVFRAARFRQAALQDMVMRNLMMATHVSNISSAVH
jgi:hypothetical protein